LSANATNHAVVNIDLARRINQGGGGFLSRQHVLDATAACFAEDGYDGTTIRAIAGRLGCAVGSIYRYFADKRQLLDAMAQRTMHAALAGLETGAVRFDDSVREYLNQIEQHREAYRLMFWLAAVGADQPQLPGVIERIIKHWADLLGDADEARRRWALMHGLAMLGETPGSILIKIGEHATKAVPASHPARVPTPAPVIVNQAPSDPKVEKEIEVEEDLREDVTLL
jgi:AcrR family transcriptional regulator